MIADIHVHSNYSTDSEAKMEDTVKHAIEIGLPVLCFTDHIDWDYPVEGLTFDFDISRYMNEIEALQKKYSGQIEILKGVELGLQPQLSDRYKKLLRDYPFDFAIGSQHLVNQMDPYYPETFEGRRDADVFYDYFKNMLEDVKAFHSFDTLGHLDYVVRYGKNKAHDYSYKAYADVIDEILKLLVKYNIAIELNTCGLRKQLGFPNPHPDVLRRYHELGGTLVTVGSDSHKPYYLGYAFDTAARILSSCGFTHYCYYKNRKPKFVKL